MSRNWTRSKRPQAPMCGRHKHLPTHQVWGYYPRQKKQICHSMVVCKVKPHKEDPNQTCTTVIGSQICYPGDVGTPTGSLDLVKLIINSVLPRHNARFFSFHLKTFTSKPRWSNPNMCASRSLTSHKNSSSNTTLHKQPKMSGSILRSSAVVTAYRNRPTFRWPPAHPSWEGGILRIRHNTWPLDP